MPSPPRPHDHALDPSAGTTAGGLERSLGWASVGLGLPALLAPGRVAEAVGVRPTDGTTALLRGVGVQELQVAAGLIARPRPLLSQWSRVAGDAAHLFLLAAAAGSGNSDRRRVHRTMALVGGITLLDVVAAVRLGRRSSAPPLRAATAITIRRSPEDVYGYWRDFTNFPSFMHHLESVEELDAQRSRWVAKAPAGRTVSWDAEITREEPNELLAWRSLKGATVANRGEVRFTRAPKGQGTEIFVELHYAPPAGRLGAAIAGVFGEHPNQQLADDLRRLKQVLETGEVVRSDAIPDGTRVQRQLHLHQRPAQPMGAEGNGAR